MDIFDTLTKMASSRSIPIYRWSSAGPQQKKVKGRNLFLSEEDARHSCREFQTVTGRGAHTVRVKSSQVTLPPLLPFFQEVLERGIQAKIMDYGDSFCPLNLADGSQLTTFTGKAALFGEAAVR